MGVGRAVLITLAGLAVFSVWAAMLARWSWEAEAGRAMVIMLLGFVTAWAFSYPVARSVERWA